MTRTLWQVAFMFFFFSYFYFLKFYFIFKPQTLYQFCQTSKRIHHRYMFLNTFFYQNLLLIVVQLLSCVQLFVISWTIVCQAPLFMGFAWQGYWSRLPFPSLRDLLNPGTEPTLPALARGVCPTEPPEKPHEKLLLCIHLKKEETNKNRPFLSPNNTDRTL